VGWETYGGTRPMGEPAPNAGYNGAIERWGKPPYGGTRWGKPPPTRAIMGLLRGGGNRPMGETAPNAVY